ncbi:hypothetical protein QFC22_004457 [Naganishia vaughanmartiniae]|uniref:Uncharacterized protein n=1 Tax=Naganishia vaughanmartiniae TaxID=1424756 RepID=A0ACC2X149_9TREE|nr:hypothetical protein QFC22_004457 [Naganishia vaughanmartiniae]
MPSCRSTMTSLQRQAPPRSILLPSPTKSNYELPLQHPYPARYPRESYSAPSSAGYTTTSTSNKPIGAASDVPGRRRTSITIEERPRIVVRPLVGNDDSQRRNRRRSSATSTTSGTVSPIVPQSCGGKDKTSEDYGKLAVAGVSRKTSTSKAFANLFRKKKGPKDESDAPASLKEKDMSSVSLEGEIMEYGRNNDQTITIKAIRKRALSTSPESRPSNDQHQRSGETSLKPNFPAAPVRRVSESDVERRQENETVDSSARFRRPMLTLNMRTQSATAPRIGSPISVQTPITSPNLNDSYGHDQYQPRRRSSTRLISPSSASASSRAKSSSRVTSPTSPGFSNFQGFASSITTSLQSTGLGYGSEFGGTGLHSPTSPMAASPVFSSLQNQHPSSSVPFSLTIRRKSDGFHASPPRQSQQQQQQHRAGSGSIQSSTEYQGVVEQKTLQQVHPFDPAQFDDGSDNEGGADRRSTVTQRTRPSPEPTAFGKRTSSALNASTSSSGPATPILTEIPITVISASDLAPMMQRSESGPPPTFKFIPATPIAPEEKDEEGGDSDASQRNDGSMGGESKRKKNRNSLPPVPINPIRPRKLELVLDLNTTPVKVQAPHRTESDSTPVQATTPITALDSLLNDNAFHDPDANEAFEQDDLANYSYASSSGPVRSPSRESLMRNTVPLRLSNSPRLVTATDVCRPVNSSLSMASSCQSSHALTLSSSSTIASSLDSLHTLDLEDVESALGSMLASLSTRPSLASRLTLTDPQLGEPRNVKPNERVPAEMGLSALGFGGPDLNAADYDYNAETPTRRDHRHSWIPQNETEPVNAYATEYVAGRDSYDGEADAEVNDSETDSIFSDIDDLGSVSIAVVHKKSPGMFASPRTLSMEDANTKQSPR